MNLLNIFKNNKKEDERLKKIEQERQVTRITNDLQIKHYNELSEVKKNHNKKEQKLEFTIFKNEEQIKELEEKIKSLNQNKKYNTVIDISEELENKKTYTLRANTVEMLKNLKASLYEDNPDVTLNELVDQAIQIYCNNYDKLEIKFREI